MQCHGAQCHDARRQIGRCHAGAVRSALFAACGAVLAAVVGLVGCASPGQRAAAGPPAGTPGSPATSHVENGGHAGAARSYWTAGRFEHARPWVVAAAYVPGARAARMVGASMRVGALFSHDAGGDHFCTASVVASRGRDMLITAAHCVHGGRAKTYRRDIVFVPGYRDGTAPRGVWVPRAMFVARGWARSADPALDVAFIVLQALDGEHIQAVLGANKLGVNQGFRHVVRVTGYPGSGEEPITCVNRTTQRSRYQMRFACKGYSPGTSGSPWVMRFDPGAHTGLIIGVIGGYQGGGDTADVSYSPYFDDNIEKLYDQAASQS